MCPLLYVCPHTDILLYVCPHTDICVSSGLYVRLQEVKELMPRDAYMCPHTTIYVSSYYCICPHTDICVSYWLYVGPRR